jgi:O-antigen/teichoic acid export membrane protein
MSRIVKIFKGSTLRTITLFMNIIVVFSLMPFIINKLGVEIYGLWALVGSITGYYFLLDFGISDAVSRFVAISIGKKRKNDVKIYVSNSIFLFSLISLATISLTIIIVIFFTKYLVPTELLQVSKYVFLIMGFHLAISFPLNTYQGVLRANVDFEIISIFEIMKLFIRTILIVVLLSQNYGIIVLSLITALANLTFYIVGFLYSRKKYPEIKFSIKKVNRKYLKKIFSFSKYVFIIQIGDLFRFKIDELMISIFLGLSNITIYSIATKIMNYFLQIMVRIMNVLNPIFSQYAGQKNFKAIQEKYILGVRSSTMIAYFIGANLIIFGQGFIRSWLGDDYISSYPILVVLCIGYITILSLMNSLGVLQSLNKHKIFAYYNLLEGFLNLFLTLLLIKKWGLLGVALGTAIPMFLIKIIVLPYYTCKYTHLKFSIFLKKTIKVNLIMILFFILFYFTINNIINLSRLSFLGIGIIIFIELLLLLPILLLIVFNDEEKNYLIKIKKGLFKKFKNS